MRSATSSPGFSRYSKCPNRHFGYHEDPGHEPEQNGKIYWKLPREVDFKNPLSTLTFEVDLGLKRQENLILFEWFTRKITRINNLNDAVPNSCNPLSSQRANK